ncbi:MAG: alpha/beta hydrolase family protein [Acidobacteriota bacterium]
MQPLIAHSLTLVARKWARKWVAAVVIVLAIAGSAAAFGPPYRTLDDRYQVAAHPSRQAWEQRAAYLRDRILASSGLLPLPEKTPLRTVVFGEKKQDGYSVLKVYFESLPGFFVTGNLYRPAGAGPFPAIVSPHGHWTNGRLENTALASVPGRAIQLARMGFVVFSYDMIGYLDSRQLNHRFGGRRENLWGLSLAGLQLWNSIRAVDFLESLPEVDAARIGATGASGGGTQTFLLAGADSRVKVAAPVNMISLHMQGGCLCENPPGLRLDTNNVELAACIAPRPLLMVSASGDWTKETLELEFPEMRKIYALAGAADHVDAMQVQAPHNYNRQSREAVYAWMARWLQGRPAGTKIEEKSFSVEVLPDLLVFYGRPLPANGVSAEELTKNWIAAARKQLADTPVETRQRALAHALGASLPPATAPARPAGGPVSVVLAYDSAQLESRLAAAGHTVQRVAFTLPDAAAAAKISHFETYNRTVASQRVADIAHAITEARAASNRPVALIADGSAALAALLAQAIAPVERSILDVGQFDTSSDEAFVEQFYIPGIRRAGDFQTAVSFAPDRIVIHNAGSSFQVTGPRVEARQLRVEEILKLLSYWPATFKSEGLRTKVLRTKD